MRGNVLIRIADVNIMFAQCMRRFPFVFVNCYVAMPVCTCRCVVLNAIACERRHPSFAFTARTALDGAAGYYSGKYKYVDSMSMQPTYI